MLKKTIKFDDLDGVEVQDDYYFHMSIDDLAAWNDTREGGMEKYLSETLAAGKTMELFDIFRGLIASSVGVKSEDNRSFIKNKTITEHFVGSEAYSSLVLELITDTTGAKAIEFFNGVMPRKLQEQVKALGAGKLELPETPPKPKTLDDYTMTELTNMPYDEFDRLLRSAQKGSLSKEHLQLAFQRRP